MKSGSQTLSRIRADVPHYVRIMYVFSIGMKAIEKKDNDCGFNTQSSVKMKFYCSVLP